MEVVFVEMVEEVSLPAELSLAVLHPAREHAGPALELRLVLLAVFIILKILSAWLAPLQQLPVDGEFVVLQLSDAAEGRPAVFAEPLEFAAARILSRFAQEGLQVHRHRALCICFRVPKSSNTKVGFQCLVFVILIPPLPLQV